MSCHHDTQTDRQTDRRSDRILLPEHFRAAGHQDNSESRVLSHLARELLDRDIVNRGRDAKIRVERAFPESRPQKSIWRIEKRRRTENSLDNHVGDHVVRSRRCAARTGRHHIRARSHSGRQHEL